MWTRWRLLSGISPPRTHCHTTNGNPRHCWIPLQRNVYERLTRRTVIEGRTGFNEHQLTEIRPRSQIDWPDKKRLRPIMDLDLGLLGSLELIRDIWKKCFFIRDRTGIGVLGSSSNSFSFLMPIRAPDCLRSFTLCFSSWLFHQFTTSLLLSPPNVKVSKNMPVLVSRAS